MLPSKGHLYGSKLSRFVLCIVTLFVCLVRVYERSSNIEVDLLLVELICTSWDKVAA